MADQEMNKKEAPHDLSMYIEMKSGPKPARSCTDLSCCIFLGLFTGLIILIAYLGLSTGNPKILAQPYDMDHHPCGVGEYESYPFIYFPSPKNLKRNVCIKSCPTKDSTQIECAKNTICPAGVLKSDVNNQITIYETIPVADKICIPMNKEYFNSVKESIDIGYVEGMASDLRNTWMICSFSALAALIFGFIFMLLVRVAAGSVIWTFILLIFVSLTSLGSLFAFQYLQLTNPPELDNSVKNNDAFKVMANAMSIFKDKETVLTVAVVFLSLDLLFVVCVLCFCSKINKASSVIEASARFLTENPRIMLISLVSFVCSIGFFAFWFISGLYLYSSGGISDKPNQLPFGQVKLTTDIKIMGWTHIFGLFWYESFFAAVQQMVIIGATCFWYFKADEKDDSNTTQGAKLVFRYHLGTAAFGSFLLGVLSFIKFLISIIATSAKKFEEKGKDSKFFSYLYKSLFCFVYMFEKCLQHINQSAYVYTIMNGGDFCPSAKQAIGLYAHNFVNMGLVAGIGELFEFLGNACVCGITTLGAYFIITETKYYQERVDNPFAPVLVIGIVSYYTGSFVMSLFGTVCESLIAIYCIDCSDGSLSKNCPKELQEFAKSQD